MLTCTQPSIGMPKVTVECDIAVGSSGVKGRAGDANVGEYGNVFVAVEASNCFADVSDVVIDCEQYETTMSVKLRVEMSALCGALSLTLAIVFLRTVL